MTTPTTAPTPTIYRNTAPNAASMDTLDELTAEYDATQPALLPTIRRLLTTNRLEDEQTAHRLLRAYERALYTALAEGLKERGLTAPRETNLSSYTDWARRQMFSAAIN